MRQEGVFKSPPNASRISEFSVKSGRRHGSLFQEQISTTELIYPQSDSELLVESYSEGEEESISKLRRLTSCSVSDDTTAPVTAVEIRSLIERKEELERRQRKQDRHRQRVQVSVSRFACDLVVHESDMLAIDIDSSTR